MALPVWRSKGTDAHTATPTTGCTPGLPTGWAQDDVFVATVTTSDAGTLNTPAGWVLKHTQSQASSQLYIFWRRATASESAPTFDAANNTPGYILAVISAYSGCDTSTDPFHQITGANATSSTSVSFPSVTTTTADCLICNAISVGTDSISSTLISGWTNAALSSITERYDQATDDDVGGGLAFATAGLATAGAVGNTTATLATASGQAKVTFALMPPQLRTGDLSKTLAAATISAAGAAAIVGTLSKTLAVLAISAAGTHPVTGNFSKSLGAVVSSAAGGVATGGALSGTLGAVTIASAGTADPFLNLNVTLGALTLSSGGAAAIAGAGAITLGAVTSSAAGGVVVAGALSKTLGGLTITASGLRELRGALTVTLASITPTIAGSFPVTADLSKTLGAASISSAANVLVGCALTGTLGALSGAIDGVVATGGVVNATLGSLAPSVAGVVATGGVLNKTLAGLGLSGVGVVATGGALNATMAGLDLSADATHPVTGNLRGQNLIGYSEEFEQGSGWSKTQSGGALAPVVTANQATNPVDGRMTADLVVFDVSGGSGGDFSQISSQGVTRAIGEAFNSSFYLRTSDGSTVTMTLVNVIGNTAPITITPTWQRFELANTSGTAGSAGQRLRLRASESTSLFASIYMFGGQTTYGLTIQTYQRTGPAPGAPLADLGINLAGAVDQQGALTVTLGGLGLVADGTGFPIILGDLSQTLGGLLVSAAGTVATGGILTTTLAPVTITAAGAIAIEGNVRGGNLIANSMMVGGSSGVAPTGWSVSPATSLTPTYVGSGTEGGKTYYDFRFAGTPASSETRVHATGGGGGAANITPVRRGQQYAFGSDVKVTGSGPTTISARIEQRDSGGVFLTSTSSTPISVTGAVQHPTHGTQLTATGVNRLTMCVVIATAVGSPVDYTVRVYVPQANDGLVEQTFQPTYGVVGAPLGSLAISTAAGAAVAGVLSKTLDPMTVVAAGAAPVVGNLCGQNLLLSTQDLGQPAWVQSRSTVLENVVLASDGTFTADKIVETANAGTHRIYQVNSKAGAALTYTVAAEFKAAERGFAQIRVAEGGEANASGVAINLSTGAVSAPYGAFTSMSAASDPLADGWFRLRFQFTTLTDLSLVVFLLPALDIAAAVPSYTGDGVSGIYASKVQLQRGAWTAYQYNGAVLGGLLAPLGVTSAGSVATGGALSKVLGSLTLTGSGAVLAAGSLTQALAPLSATIDAGNLVTGDLSRSLGAAAVSSAGGVSTGGVVNNTLGAMVLASTGQLAIAGVVAGKNLITQSERPDLSPWSNTYAVITPNAALAPNGTTTAAHIAPNNGTGWGSSGRIYTVTKPAQAMKMTWAFSAKADQYNRVLIWMNGGNTSTDRCYAYVNVSTGAVVSGPVAGTSGFADVVLAVTAEANGFWRISLTATTDAATVLTGRIYAYNSSGSGLGDGVSGVLAWGFMANYGDPIAYEYQGATNSALMGPLTLSGAGAVAIAGALTRTLGPLAIVAAGAVANIGALTTTLGPASITAAGAVVAGGTLAKTLGALGFTIAGQVATGGLLTVTMAPVVSSAAGGVAIAANLNRTFGALTLNSAGAVQMMGSLSVVLGNASLASAGGVAVSGNLARLLGPAAISAAGQAAIQGSLTRTFGPMSGAATGKVWPFRRFFFSLN